MSETLTMHSKSENGPPMKRVASLWNWLPAFRAVAETEHLPRAAALLGTSPPALSRTLKLLEKAVGAPLFHRTGTRLVLNDQGRRLLAHVREAMRIVDEGLGNEGRLVRVSLPEGLARALLDIPYERAIIEGDAAGALLRGDVDVVVLTGGAEGGADIAATPLGELRLSSDAGELARFDITALHRRGVAGVDATAGVVDAIRRRLAPQR